MKLADWLNLIGSAFIASTLSCGPDSSPRGGSTSPDALPLEEMKVPQAYPGLSLVIRQASASAGARALGFTVELAGHTFRGNDIRGQFLIQTCETDKAFPAACRFTDLSQDLLWVRENRVHEKALVDVKVPTPEGRQFVFVRVRYCESACIESTVKASPNITSH